MTTLIISVIVGWILISAIVVVSVSMMSARISRMEESQRELPVIELSPASSASATSNRIPTQPRPEVVR